MCFPLFWDCFLNFKILAASIEGTSLFLKQRTFDMNVKIAIGGFYIMDDPNSIDTVYHVETKGVQGNNIWHIPHQISFHIKN